MRLTINGENMDIPDEQSERMLVWVLRDHLGLTGTKFGCGEGICGSCTILVDGSPTRSCITPAKNAAGKQIITLEGLAETGPDGEMVMHPVQEAFWEVQTPQCSWCMTGQMLTAAALIEQKPDPTDEEIISAMDRVYCRCGTYIRIRKAVRLAAEIKAQRGQS